MENLESLGWRKSQSFYCGKQYWYKKDVYIHDNSHGTIQVGIVIDRGLYNSMIPCTFIDYQDQKDVPLTFELAAQIFDELIESGFIDGKGVMYHKIIEVRADISNCL